MEAEPIKNEPPKRKRRWFQFSLRTLLLAVFIVAIGMAAWIAPIKNRAQRQKEAVDAILKGGGWVVYDYQEYGGRIHEDAKPPGPDWLRKLLGDDVFTNVIAANVESNDGLKRLCDLRHLRSLYVVDSLRDDAAITDEGYENIVGLTQLEGLAIGGSNFTDANLKRLQGLSQMKGLDVSNTKITDAGLEYLKGMPHLQSLCLRHTAVTDNGLIHLKGLTQLRLLFLSGTKVTDTGVNELRKALPNCEIQRGYTPP